MCRIYYSHILFRFVWRQLEFAFFGAATPVAALFVYHKYEKENCMAFLKIKRNHYAGEYNPLVTITVNETEYTVENGKELTLELEQDNVYLVTFSCPKYNNGLSEERIKIKLSSDFDLKFNCIQGYIQVGYVGSNGTMILPQTDCDGISYYQCNAPKTMSTKTMSTSTNQGNLFVELWKNTTSTFKIMVALSIVIFISACVFLSPDSRLVFIVSMIVFEPIAIAVVSCASNLDREKNILIATIFALIFATLLCIICGIEFRDGGCSHCNYKVYFGGNCGTIIDCPKC